MDGKEWRRAQRNLLLTLGTGIAPLKHITNMIPLIPSERHTQRTGGGWGGNVGRLQTGSHQDLSFVNIL